MARLALALVHHPCVDKNGAIYTTSVTNLDVHDIARASKTYGVDTFYVVTPIAAQRALVGAITSFWDEGPGAKRNRDRHEALKLVEVVATIEDAIAMERERGAPLVVSTSARPSTVAVEPSALRAQLDGGQDVLLMFGTGYGLADHCLDLADARLTALFGPTDFNHLSVRAAIAIYLDRLRGRVQ